MRQIYWILAMWLVLLHVYLGAAMPSLDGPTGLLTIPTAESLQFMEVNIGADYLWSQSKAGEAWKIKANVGTFKNLELGVVGGTVPTEGAFLNIKYFLMADAQRYPLSLAVGVQNLFSHSRTELYMVASKSFPYPIRLHLGFKAALTNADIIPYVMGGVEYFMSHPVSAVVDFTGGNKLYKFNAGIRWTVMDDLAVQIAFLDLGRTDQNGASSTIGASFSRPF